MMNIKLNNFIANLCRRSKLLLFIFIGLILSSAEILNAASGSGTATITPADDVTVGSSGEWTITYIASENFSNGEVSLSIPAGWTVPQSSDSSSSGYVTVSSEGILAADPISIASSVIVISIDSLTTADTVAIVYGDSTELSSGQAAAQNSVESGIEFTVSSDPSGSSPVAISSSPVLNTTPDEIDSIIFTTPETSVIAGDITDKIRIQTVDQYNNPSSVSSDQVVNLSSTSSDGEFSISGGGGFSDTSSVTILSGEDTTSFYYRDITVGTPDITASAQGQSWTDAQQQVTVNPGSPLNIEITPRDTTITAGDYARFIISVEDTFGNESPLSSDQTIDLIKAGGDFYEIYDHSTSILGTVIPSGNSSKEVDYMNTNMEMNLGYLLVFDDDSSPPDLNQTNTNVYVNNAAFNSDSSSISSGNDTLTANGTDQLALTVVVRDEYNNPISGSTVLFESTGTGNDITQPADTTGSDGIAAGIMTSTVAEQKVIRATVDGLYLTDSLEVLYEPGAADLAASSLSGDTNVVTANGTDQLALTVVVRDQYNNPISGSTVLFESTGTGNDITQPADTTGSDGIAAGIMTSTAAEQKVIRATVDGLYLTDSLEVLYEPGAADLAASSLSGDTNVVTANGTDQLALTVVVRDQYNNPISGSTVLFESTGTGNDITQPADTTGSDGIAAGIMTSTAAEQKVIRATVDGLYLTDSLEVLYEPGAADLAASSLSGDTNVVTANGTDQLALTVVVRDQYNNPISGSTVLFESTGTGNDITQPADTTGSDGIAAGIMTSTAAEQKVIRATVDGLYLTDSLEVLYEPGAADLAASSLSGDTNVVTANGTDQLALTVVVRDQYNNPISGSTVLFESTGTGNDITQPADTTGSDGIAAGIMTSTVAEQKVIRATVDGLYLTDTLEVLFEPGAADLAASSLSGDTNVVTANGTDQLALTVVVRDQYNNPISGSTVLFESTGTGNDITQPADTTGSDGIAAGIMTSTAAEQKVIRATVDGLYLTDSLEVLYEPGAADLAASSLSGDTNVVTANGTDQLALTVVVRDQYNNPISGSTVLFESTGTGNDITQPADTTGSDGIAAGIMTSTVAEQKVIRATVDGLYLTDTLEVLFEPGAADLAASSLSGDTNVVTANGTDQLALTVVVRDQYNNPISGSTVLFESTGTGNDITQPADTTGSDGIAAGIMTSTAAEQKVIRATVDGLYLTDTLEVLFEPGDLSRFVILHDGEATAGIGENITFEVRDADNNLKRNFEDTVKIYTNTTDLADRISWGIGTGTGTIIAEDTDTLSYRFSPTDNGEITLLFTDNKAESIIITAESGGVISTGPGLSVGHAQQDRIIIESGNNQREVVGNPAQNPIIVRVEDEWSNPVDGAEVIFSVTDGGGEIDTDTLTSGLQNNSYSNSSGLAECQSWILGTVSGYESDQVRASISSGSVTTVSFSATTDHDIPAAITIAPPGGNVTVNSSERVVATLRDQYSNLVTGKDIYLYIRDYPDGNLSLDGSNSNPTYSVGSSTRYGTTDSTGTISVLYNTSATAGLADTMDAYHNPEVPADSVSDIAFTSVASGATSLDVINITPQPVEAGETFSFMIRAVDSNGNLDPDNSSHISLTPESEGEIVFSLSDFGAEVTEGDLVNGELTLYGRAEKKGQWNIDLSAIAPTLTSTIFNVDVSANSTIASYQVNASQSVIAGEDFSFEVRAEDSFENFIPTASRYIKIRAVSAIDTSQSAGDTLSISAGNIVNGIFSTNNINYKKAERIKIEVTDTVSSIVRCSDTINVDHTQAYQIIEIAGDTTSVTAGDSVIIRSAVEDVYGNRVGGEPVSFAVLEGGGNLQSAQETTDSAGTTSVTYYTGEYAGLNRVRAAILDGYPEGLETRVYEISTVADNVISYVDLVVGGSSFEAGQVFSCQASAYDHNDNLIVSDDTTKLIPVAESSGMLFSQDTLVLSGGEVSFTAVDTIAGDNRISIESLAGEVLSPFGSYLTISPAPAYNIAKINGDTTGVISGDTIELKVSVTDKYLNIVPGEIVHFIITTNLGGTPVLIDDNGDPGDGLDISDSTGTAACSLVTDINAGTNGVAATILDGDPPSRERTDFNVSTTAGNISRYEISTGNYTHTAGNNFDVEIVAFDMNDNIAYGDDTTQVELSSDGSALFSNDTLVLSDGSATVIVHDNIAERVVLSARTLGGGALSFSDTLTIDPDIPSGTIGIYSVIPDTITADSRSTSAITTDPITDTFGNIVQEGTQITVSVTDGLISSDDMNTSLAGVQRVSGSTGRISVFTRSSGTPGDVTVAFNSVEGSAAGSANLVFAPQPQCQYGGYLAPAVIVPDSSAAFKCLIENVSPTGVNIDGSSRISFSDGVSTFSAALGSSYFIPGLSSDTLVFNESTVPSSLFGGTYTPKVTVTGNDVYSSEYTTQFDAGYNSVSVSIVEIEDITLYKTILSRGDTSQVDVTVKNGGGSDVFVNGLQLKFSTGDYSLLDNWQPPLVDTISSGMSKTYSRLVSVLPGSPVGIDTVDATVHATSDGMDVYDYSADENIRTWLIQSAARFTYQAGTIQPEVVSRGQSHAFSISLENTGQAAVIIDRNNTNLSFSDGTESFTVYPEVDEALPGLAVTDIDFTAGMIPSSMDVAKYPVLLTLSGEENGADFDTSFVLGDSVNVVLPAELDYLPASLTPVSVSKNSWVSFTAGLSNSGGANVICNSESTYIRFDDGSVYYTSSLNDQQGDTLSPGNNTLYFESAAVPTDMITGNYSPVIHVEGYENGLPFTDDIYPDTSITIEEPSRLAINSIDVTPRDLVTKDQQAYWTGSIKVQNNGEAAVRLDSVQCRLYSGSSIVTDEYLLSYIDFNPGAEELGGGQIDSFQVRFEDDTSNSMTTGMVVIEATIWGTDLNSQNELVGTTEYGGKGDFLVQTPGIPVVSAITSSVEEATVYQSKDWFVDVVLVNEGESDLAFDFDSTDTHLTFSTSDDFNVVSPSAFVSGDTILYGNSTDTLHFLIDSTGSVEGTCTINIAGTAREINSSRVIYPVQGDPGVTEDVLIQLPSLLEITGFHASQDPVTIGQLNDWYIDVNIVNSGGSDVMLDLSDHDSSTVSVQGGSGFVFDYPNELSSGGVTLKASQSGVLRFVVTTTGSVLPGKRLLSGSVVGREINSDNAVYTYPGEVTTSDSVTFELQPNPEYISSSLSPLSASAGTEISIELGVASPNSESSALDLHPSSTYITFADADSDSFRAYLSPASQHLVSGGESVVLIFESSTVDSAIAPGSYTLAAHLEGEENGNHFETDISSGSDYIEVETAPRLSITSIESPQSVTASLQPEWEVRMVVHNTGEASLDMDLSASNTYLTFNVAGSGDCTGEYTVINPGSLQKAGTDTLAGNQVDTLLFRVTITGTTTGIAVIDGHVTASDVNSANIITDDTFNGGEGYVSVQEPAILAVTGTTLSQNTITSGQTSIWEVDLLVENQGEANITLSMDSTYIYSNYSLSVPSPPSEFSGGGLSLAGGESKHLVFGVTPSPEVTVSENIEIYSHVGVFENNRTHFLSFDTGVEHTGYGIIEIQTPADISILSLKNTAPRSPFVNSDQYFPVVLEVENNGGAPADSIGVSLSSDGSSFIENPVHYIGSLAYGDVAQDTFNVRASSTVGSENFYAALEYAVDTNSGQSDITIFSNATDSTAAAEIQSSGELVIKRVVPSQEFVTAGQTSDWNLTAVVNNNGGAPVTLDQPDSGNIVFYKNSIQLTDYLVIAPDGFSSGTSGFTLQEGQTDSLRYLISSTGLDTGTVSVSCTLGWRDENIPDSSQTQVSRDSAVIVREPSGLRIISIDSDAPNNTGVQNTSIVNTSQEFNITATIENTGGDDLDSIDVALVTDGTSLISTADSCPQLGTAEQGVFVFNVTASLNPGVEVLSASIVKAVSVSTGEEISPLQAVESAENIEIQNAAELALTIGIISPAGAVDDTISTEQSFIVNATVNNNGEAEVDNSGEISITLPDGFSLADSASEPLARSFVVDEDITWTLISPSIPDPSDTLSVGITAVPIDVNIDKPAFRAEPYDSIIILTEEKAMVKNCGLAVDSPPGAVDGLLSTDQDFTVRASATPSSNSDEVWLELLLPGGYSAEGDLRRNIGNGEGIERSVVWNLSAPPDEDPQPMQIELTTGGKDINSGSSFSGCVSSLEVETESAAVIDLSAFISGPEQALEGELSVSLPFNIQAEVANSGSAGVNTDEASLKVDLPPGYTFVDGDSIRQFSIGEPVTWNLKAPSSMSPPGNIRVHFREPYAIDVNTDKAAQIGTGEISIPVKTDAGIVSMSNISKNDTIAIPPHVVPQGARNVPMLKVSFRNMSAYTVGLDTLFVTVRDVNGLDVENPSQVVDSVSFVAGEVKYSTRATDVNPVPVIVDHAFTINSTDSAAAILEVDIASGAPAGGMRIELVSNDDVRLSIGGESTPVSVVWSGDDDEITGHFFNTPFTIMSSNFSEYTHNYPNPFRAGSEETQIAYFLTENSDVQIRIYDYTGELVWSKDIASGGVGATGSTDKIYHSTPWDGRNGRGNIVRNGVYICKITAGSNSAIFKIGVAK
ncbi:MAG: Ig-like domain-containing protein [Candidatus Krumholzibacteriota bacterium]|nr:Ig-like domain-containing protein [Candidatus Krumholzibacteriota bacterium]